MGTDHDGGSLRSERGNLPEAQEEGSPAPEIDPVRIEPDYAIRKMGMTYEGVNLVRGLKARFEEDGRVILNHAFRLEGSFDVKVKVTGHGREGSVDPVGTGFIETGKCFVTGGMGCEDTLVIVRPRFSEWYVNCQDGLEQGFVIAERPAGGGDLVIEMSIEGSDAVVTKVGERIVFGVSDPEVAPFGPRIFYEDLVIHDFSGKNAKGGIELLDREIRLVVPDEGLAYPLYIDPYFRTDYWKKYGDYNYAHFGMSLAAGDFDHNGCDDLAVGSPDYTNGQTNEGLVQVFNGHSTGLSTTADWTRESNCSNSKYGLSLAACNFRNGLYDDLIVGAPYLSNGQPGEGRVVVYYGKAGGLCTTCGSGDYWLKDSDHTGGHFGKAVACGNFNGDSYHDLAASIPEYSYGMEDEGLAFFYTGTAGSNPYPRWDEDSDVAGVKFGYAVAMGDFDCDGNSDIAIGAPCSDNPRPDGGYVQVFYSAY